MRYCLHNPSWHRIRHWGGSGEIKILVMEVTVVTVMGPRQTYEILVIREYQWVYDEWVWSSKLENAQEWGLDPPHHQAENRPHPDSDTLRTRTGISWVQRGGSLLSEGPWGLHQASWRPCVAWMSWMPPRRSGLCLQGAPNRHISVEALLAQHSGWVGLGRRPELDVLAT